MDPNKKKLIMHTIQKECLVAVSECIDAKIQQIIESDIAITNFINQIWENTKQRLQEKGNYQLLQHSLIKDFDPHHKVRTIIGSMRTCIRDVKNEVPPTCNIQKIELWDK